MIRLPLRVRVTLASGASIAVILGALSLVEINVSPSTVDRGQMKDYVDSAHGTLRDAWKKQVALQ